MDVGSVGHRLTILKAVYEIKVKQNVPMEPDDYIPLCMSSQSPFALIKTNVRFSRRHISAGSPTHTR